MIGGDEILTRLVAAEQAVREREAEIARLERDYSALLDERDSFEIAISDAHVALGGDGEWCAKLPREEPPDSGNLALDVPALAAQVVADCDRLREALRWYRQMVSELAMGVVGGTEERDEAKAEAADEAYQELLLDAGQRAALGEGGRWTTMPTR